MDENRRDFLKKAGVGSLVGLGVASAIGVVANKDAEASSATGNASGKRLAMVIDTRKGPEAFEKCQEVCHAIHNVPEFKLEDGSPDLKNEIKWIWDEPYHNAFPSKSGEFLSDTLDSKKVLVLCNHCKNPPCVRVCPTQATFKRESDGIVLMDFHRCVGCRFCMAACPYGSRSFNWKDPREENGQKVVGGRKVDPKFPTRERGVVEKCNFCAERLAKGQIPACVEQCEDGALTFGDLNDPNSEVHKLLKENNTIQRKPELGTGPSVFYIV
jgi:molybdopterin-containing oxidoreductase family iron-sulfur binding subunit